MKVPVGAWPRAFKGHVEDALSFSMDVHFDGGPFDLECKHLFSSKHFTLSLLVP
jgi:hypothetical protein